MARMIPDELFEQLLQEFSSDPVHDYILKTFSSSPLKPGETEFFYLPLGIDTFTAFDEQRSRIGLKGFIIRSLHLPKNS